ncbi:hypothetical protein [Actinomadura miaoliensis]|uniref:DUF4240 domain-containing protein n=1 Tax=Actinomadura miaoliensis TaxID=430685 RepID=A0ABP7VUD0_9ACTN
MNRDDFWRLIFEPMWDFEEDKAETRRRLPRVWALYEHHYA